MIIKRHPV